jgi:hypothetical protein
VARYPGAVWRPEGATPGGFIVPRLLIFHSEATKGRARPHSGLEWHFMVFRDGAVDQLVDTMRRADANYRANPFAISVETEDDGDPDNEPWTDEQMWSMAELAVWAHEHHPIPLSQADHWNGSGIGYHTLWGAPSPWTPVVKTCPGRARKAQWPELMRRIAILAAPPPVPVKPPPVVTTVEVDPMQVREVLLELEHVMYGQFRGRWDPGFGRPPVVLEAAVWGPSPDDHDGWWDHSIGATVRYQTRGNEVIVTASQRVGATPAPGSVLPVHLVAA